MFAVKFFTFMTFCCTRGMVTFTNNHVKSYARGLNFYTPDFSIVPRKKLASTPADRR